VRLLALLQLVRSKPASALKALPLPLTHQQGL
jgi:hypothetical protein